MTTNQVVGGSTPSGRASFFLVIFDAYEAMQMRLNMGKSPRGTTGVPNNGEFEPSIQSIFDLGLKHRCGSRMILRLALNKQVELRVFVSTVISPSGDTVEVNAWLKIEPDDLKPFAYSTPTVLNRDNIRLSHLRLPNGEVGLYRARAGEIFPAKADEARLHSASATDSSKRRPKPASEETTAKVIAAAKDLLKGSTKLELWRKQNLSCEAIARELSNARNKEYLTSRFENIPTEQTIARILQANRASFADINPK